MIFANKVLELLTGPDAPPVGALDLRLRASLRYRLSTLARDAMFTCAKRPGAIEASRGFFFLPSPQTWIEWEEDDGTKAGWLLIGEGDSILHGTAYVFIALPGGAPTQMLQFYLELRAGAAGPPLRIGTDLVTAGDDGGFDAIPATIQRGLMAEARALYAPTLLGAIALLASPRTVHTAPGDDLSRLNKARAAKHRLPLLDWVTVTINLDDPAHTRETTVGEGPRTGTMPLHFVRAHLRLVSGRVVLVRPHFRGNPDHGTRITSYRVVRDEDLQ